MLTVNKRVLLIDDDPDEAEIFSEALNGLEVETILDCLDNGEKALEKLLHDAPVIPDVIFLDINMPVMSGWDCLRELKKLAILRQIPIVMYSNSSPEKEGLTASDIGATAFLTKPGTIMELRSSLDELFTTLFRWSTCYPER